jgi:predicted metal-binding membrane protein
MLASTLSSAHAHGHAGQPLIYSVLMWQVMMTAMMAPTVAPWIRAVHKFAGRGENRAQRMSTTAAFASAYLVVWLGYSVCAAIAQALLQHAGILDPVHGMRASFRGGVLVIAGLFQFAPLKQACLVHCRNPFTYLLARWRNGPVGGFRLGFGHGVYCVGCCWALMATALALGVMNMWWMAALTVVVFVETVVPYGSWIRVPLAIALVGAGAVMMAG